MASIQTIFWDLGGVLLTNAWDHTEREAALARFHMDPAEFTPAHEKVVALFETGQITLDEYLDRTVFAKPRDFSREEFKRHMFSLSQPLPERIRLARDLAKSGRYSMGTINNESRELDLYRIQTFSLTEIFSIFVSSCFVGFRKPDERIYRCALDLTQRNAGECCFVDDREENLSVPAKLGMKVVLARKTEQIQADLRKYGIGIEG